LKNTCQSALSEPFAKTSIRFGPHATAAGSEVKFPPRDSQLALQPLVTSHDLWYRDEFVPTTNTSSRPELHEDTAGPAFAWSVPPSDSHPDQPFVLNAMWYSEASWPRANTSMTPFAREIAAGDEVIVPPRDSQRVHPAAS
jgi:hypothetical protein